MGFWDSVGNALDPGRLTNILTGDDIATWDEFVDNSMDADPLGINHELGINDAITGPQEDIGENPELIAMDLTHNPIPGSGGGSSGLSRSQGLTGSQLLQLGNAQASAYERAAGLQSGAAIEAARLQSGSALEAANIQSGSALEAARIQSESALKAAELETGYLNRSLDLQKGMYDQSRSDMMPWLTAGKEALGTLVTNTQSGEYDPGQFSFGKDDFQTDPGYQFRLSEGNKALDRSAASRGLLLSGAQAKALTNYNQNTASDEYGRAYGRALTNYDANRQRLNEKYNRLAGIANTGQIQAQSLSALGSNYAGSAGNTLAGIGSSMGSGERQSGQAMGSGERQSGQALGLGAYQSGQALAVGQLGSANAQAGGIVNAAGARFSAYGSALDNDYRNAQLNMQNQHFYAGLNARGGSGGSSSGLSPDQQMQLANDAASQDRKNGRMQGALAGASTGASFGPWGAAIGAVAGYFLGGSI